jgi:hypothetical protein
MKILFVYYNSQPEFWKDGLYAALKLLEKDHDITYCNLYSEEISLDGIDFVLGWGAFGSPAYNALLDIDKPKGLCIGGNAIAPSREDEFDVLFYETPWYEDTIKHHPNIVHAFGTNTDIFKAITTPEIFDVLSVGSFSLWKRHEKLTLMKGARLVVGEIQKDNMQESLFIIGSLVIDGVGVMGMVPPETLAYLYNVSSRVYVPADIIGGGERTVLEARACGRPVFVENDNPKLQSLLKCDLWDHHYYYKQLKKGIEACL